MNEILYHAFSIKHWILYENIDTKTFEAPKRNILELEVNVMRLVGASV